MVVPNSKVLIAEDTAVIGAIEVALVGCELSIAKDLSSARQHIEDDVFALFVIGAHFDESRAIELAQSISDHAKHKGKPIILVRLLPTRLQIETADVERLLETDVIHEYLELHDDPEWLFKLKAAAATRLKHFDFL